MEQDSCTQDIMQTLARMNCQLTDGSYWNFSSAKLGEECQGLTCLETIVLSGKSCTRWSARSIPDGETFDQRKERIRRSSKNTLGEEYPRILLHNSFYNLLRIDAKRFCVLSELELDDLGTLADFSDAENKNEIAHLAGALTFHDALSKERLDVAIGAYAVDLIRTRQKSIMLISPLNVDYFLIFEFPSLLKTGLNVDITELSYKNSASNGNGREFNGCIGRYGAWFANTEKPVNNGNFDNIARVLGKNKDHTLETGFILSIKDDKYLVSPYGDKT